MMGNFVKSVEQNPPLTKVYEQQNLCIILSNVVPLSCAEVLIAQVPMHYWWNKLQIAICITDTARFPLKLTKL